jgi:hypothetical protein
VIDVHASDDVSLLLLLLLLLALLCTLRHLQLIDTSGIHAHVCSAEQKALTRLSSYSLEKEGTHSA